MNTEAGVSGYSVLVDQISREQWCQVLESFADASIYQTWEYGAVRWGEMNLSHMVLRKNGQVVSAAQVRILKVPLLNVGMAYIYYGPMWKVDSRGRDIANFQAGLRALIDEYAVSRGLFLRLRPWGYDEYDGDMRSTLLNVGFRLTKGIFRDKRRTILVDMSPSEEQLRKRLKKKWRQTLQRAERQNLQIVEGFDEQLFKHFKPLFFETVELKKFKPGSDVNEFAEIQERLISSQRMRITICKLEGAPVSGSACSSIGEVAIGLLSATGGAGRRVQAYYLLQWDEILWSKRAGKSLYDLGGINPVTNPGVYRFKAGIKGQEVTLLGVFDFCKNDLFYQTIIGFEYLLRLRNRIIH